MFGLFKSKDWQKALEQIRLPGLNMPISASWVTIDEKQAVLTLPFAASEAMLEPLKADKILGTYNWQLRVAVQKLPNSQPELPMTFGNVIVVSSGKGGVGKSSVSVQLALALHQLGANVGILDADVYGPSLPTMLGGQEQKLEVNAQQKMIPHQRHGIWASSLGYLTDTKDAAIWRGPMASAALQQLFRDTKWPRLDYLIVDMPPGTGDIQLTFAQKLPITGAVVVTTPQTVALADAEKGITMFRKVGVPITGLIENMSYYQCSACGHQDAIFGSEGGAEVARREQVPLLGQWPLDSRIRAGLDCGKPLQSAEPEHELSVMMRNSAQQLAIELYAQAQQQTKQ
ncbi:iron-sulfur cluster carrier protein ApbC [Pseudidiomarina woesei]|uniref:Iron-sulfur cluster carrier protein n=1 Tax=Pseudidiomarina woesei TaxID=1381080 RepID=A0A0K6GVJ6_9GAMM|nr:iron-sulfur cluster carrier protein ApbC [Pseudidiomarina woesei]CUA82624.1 Chromosome partitioning ATPase, Mrp family, contains Fe-S cluster [Pseudidiomarina woesei]